MIDWARSIFPHRCCYCNKWIKPRTNHIAIYRYDDVERYCNPHCARLEIERQQEIARRRERLEKIIFRGEE